MIDGMKIRSLRTEKGYTSLDLAVRSNISKSYIEEIERGDKINPSFKTVEKLADALNVLIDDLRRPISKTASIENI
ncbi:DNA-binding transcriptional regulator, XRE-family HTH domain [Geosporobacter subterraneus DSM 17957]|uniref:DNA-binding transcriptional regulator, XRE-family HTH domain n=1 Tax=Geosporobacter subterraneus DSM 17957 TaxID=1121919 RepID=A0A1M6G9S4_9FIRM|nr:helix-turn-helix transcriptional regulator [Geosporobacter subterraneus]SHJ06706.1 DNA-binding transcriptional regulator, XRE-family HTH domain [Geosporobacter subterraneus DSM 17957]